MPANLLKLRSGFGSAIGARPNGHADFRTATVSNAEFFRESTRTTRAVTSELAGQPLGAPFAKRSTSKSPGWYSRAVTKQTPLAETLSDMTSSGQGNCGNRRERRRAALLRSAPRRSAGTASPLRARFAESAAKCSATAAGSAPFTRFAPCAEAHAAPLGAKRTTLAGISGCGSGASGSKGSVIQTGVPGRCASEVASSTPPRDTSLV